MKTSPSDISNKEILQELQQLRKSSEETNNRLDGVDVRLKGVEGHLESLEAPATSNEEAHQEILEAIGAFAASVDERFNRMEREIMGIKAEAEHEIAGSKTILVTKGYLDEKLADLRLYITQDTDRKIEKALA